MPQGDKYHICADCGKHFEEEIRLKCHMTTHSNTVLKCTIDKKCKRTFKRRGEQKRHETYGHRLTKDYLCKKCGKGFQSPMSRIPHMKKCIG